MNGMDWCGVWDEEKKRKRRMGKRRMWEMLGEWQNPGMVKEECQGQGKCLMSVTFHVRRKEMSHLIFQYSRGDFHFVVSYFILSGVLIHRDIESRFISSRRFSWCRSHRLLWTAVPSVPAFG